MASGSTPTYLLPYPLSSDPVNVHGDIKDLADRLEDVITGISTLPSQSGNNGKFLTTNGTVASWATVPTPSAATPTVLGTVYGIVDELGNTAIGDGVGPLLSTGTNNVFIGQDAGQNLSTGSNNIVIGYDTSASTAAAEGEITLGNNDISNLRIPGISTLMGYDHGFFTPIMTESVWEDSDTELNGEIDFELSLGNSRYFSSDATANWQVNLIWDSTTDYIDAAYVDQLDAEFSSATIVMITKQGATAYYPTDFKVDGVSQTVKWQGGTAPSAGNANSLDVYTYTIVPLSADPSPTYLVLGSQTKFA
jgi:hypothetical protein